MPCESGIFIPEKHKLIRIFTENCSKLWSSTKQYDPNDISKTNNCRTLVPAVPTSSPFGRSFRKAPNAILSRLAEGDFLSRSLTAALTLAVVTSENVAKEVLEVSSCTLRIPGILVNCGRASFQDPLFLHWLLFPAVFATYGSFSPPPSQILRSCPDEWRAFSPWPNLCPCPPPTTRGSALFWNSYSSTRCCLPDAACVYPPSIYPSPNLKADVIPPSFPPNNRQKKGLPSTRFGFITCFITAKVEIWWQTLPPIHKPNSISESTAVYILEYFRKGVYSKSKSSKQVSHTSKFNGNNIPFFSPRCVVLRPWT